MSRLRRLVPSRPAAGWPPGDCPADLAHQGPDALHLGAQPVIVPAQPVVVCLKLSYLMGERLQRGHDVLARLVCQFLGLPAWCGFAGWRCGWLAGAGCRDYVHVAARALVPVGADKPLRLAAALIAAHVHDHAARIEVFTGAPQIGLGDARDRVPYQGRERALLQPARDVIACVRRELFRHVAGPAAYVLPDTATQPSGVRPSAMRCHTATLTPPAGPRVRSTSPRPQPAAQGIQDTVLALPALDRSSCPPVMMNRPAPPKPPRNPSRFRPTVSDPASTSAKRAVPPICAAAGSSALTAWGVQIRGL